MLREVCDEVVELVRVLNPGVSDAELPGMVMVGVYMDESEDDTPGVFTLAGWLASEPTGWRDIIPAWQTMVAEAPHPISEFHMTDIAQRSGDFSDEKGWTQGERDAIVKRATDILTDKNLSGGLTAFGCSIIRSELDWQKVSSYQLYKLCYAVLMVQVCTTFSAFRSFNFVFDCKEKVRGHVEKHFWAARDSINEDPEFYGMLKGVAFQSSTDMFPLQAADFIAYERRKRNSDRVNGETRHRRSFKRLCERPHHFKVLNRCFMTRVLAEIEAAGHMEITNVYQLISDDDD